MTKQDVEKLITTGECINIESPVYSKGAEPQLIEEDIFRTIIPLVPEKSSEKITRKSSEKSSEKTVEKATQKITQKTTRKTAQKILGLIKANPYITRKELAENIGNITEDGIKYHLSQMKKQGKIKRIGPDRGGYWEGIASLD